MRWHCVHFSLCWRTSHCAAASKLQLPYADTLFPADKLADYEDELEKLKTKQARSEDIDRLNAIRARSPSPRPPTLDSPSPDAKRTSALSVAEKEEMAEEESDTVSSLPPAPAPQQSETRRPSGGLGRSLTTTRITNFLNARRTSPVAKVTAPGSESPGTPAGEVDLASRLNEAESARRAAETKLTQTNQELEELSASLFQSANEMVSNERRANAEREAEAEKKAKEREEQWQQWQEQVKANDRAAAARSRSLEKKVRRLEERVRMLEEREKEKAKRLERLEMAMKRTARVRSLLQPQGQTRPYSNVE